jgi:hypothetical protein
MLIILQLQSFKIFKKLFKLDQYKESRKRYKLI